MRQTIKQQIQHDLAGLPLNPKFQETKALKATAEHLADAVEELQSRVAELEEKKEPQLR